MPNEWPTSITLVGELSVASGREGSFYEGFTGAWTPTNPRGPFGTASTTGRLTNRPCNQLRTAL
jgi:hypothetical protein